MSTDAAAHRDANARLCRWLGIAPNGWHLAIGQSGTGFSSESLAMIAHELNPGSVLYPVYPALDTREGFWILWDALRNHPRYFRPEVWATISGACAKIGGPFIYNADTPWDALFAAAVALMEREAGK